MQYRLKARHSICELARPSLRCSFCRSLWPKDSIQWALQLRDVVMDPD